MKTNRTLRSILGAGALAFVAAIPGLLAALPASDDIQALYAGDRALAHVEALTRLGPRVAGGPVEAAAAEYIAGEMRSYGLDVAVEELPMVYFEDLGSTLELVDGTALHADTLTYSPAGSFTAELVDCGLGAPEDFPVEVAGKIALIKRGDYTFWTKTQNAAAAGALAAVIYNRLPGTFAGTLGAITDIPATGISLEEGEMLLGLMAVEPVVVHLDIDTVAYPATSRNVVGTIEGIDPDQGIVYMGGHYDSASVSPGANDDGSGAAAVLEAARVLATKGHRAKATIKLIAFGAEETGLDGSYSYVVTHEEEIAAMGIGMVNLDMIGVGDTLEIGHIGLSSPVLTAYAGEKATAMGMTWVPFAAAENSDHTYFEYVGVPVVFLTQSPDPWYHTPEDSLDKIDPIVLERNGELATAVLYDWAKNPVHREAKAARLERVHVWNERPVDVE